MASDVSHEPAATTTAAADTYPRRTGWVGWIYFASVMMIIAGTLNVLHGLVAILNDEWVVFTNRGDLYLDLTTWGWVHLGVGAAVLLAGIGVLSGNVLARAVAVFIAGVSLVTHFLYMPAYPVWALTIIAIDGFVIWALTAHGGEMRRA